MAEKKETVLIFDYDGTIHETARIYIPAVREAYARMVKDGAAPDRVIPDEAISKYLGCNLMDMWHDFMPDFTDEDIRKYGHLVGKHMWTMIARGEAGWYAGTEETLACLKERGYRMVILSNSQKKYLEINREAFRMDRFFDALYDCQSFDFIPKQEIFPVIRRDFPAADYVVIGDRFHDMEVARVHGLRSIGCLYGYGPEKELSGADVQIRDIRELKTIL